MSMIKRSLPEDIDVTDLRDTGNYGEPDEPTQADWSVNDLHTAMDRLETNKPYGYVKELKEIETRLYILIKQIELPF